MSVVAALMLWPLANRLRAALNAPTARTIWSLCVFLVVGWLATYAIPLREAPAGRESFVELSTAGHKSPSSQGSEVWFRLEVDGHPIPVSEWQSTGTWDSKDGAWVTSGPASMRWRGKVNEGLKLSLLHHPWSGIADIDIDGKSQTLDLYAPESEQGMRAIDWSATGSAGPYLHTPSRNALQRWIHAIDSVLIGLALFFLFELLTFRAPPQTNTREPRWLTEIACMSTPMVLVWATFLLAFFPGVMTPDSTDQWRQASSGIYNDWHPPYHTMAIGALRRAWDSPAIVASVQAMMLALAIAWLISTVRRAAGAPRWAGHAAAWLCALSPILSITSITLWKDVPYAASVVAITAGSISILSAKSLHLRIWWKLGAVALLMLMAMLLRHNGPPVALAVIASLWWLMRGQRKALSVLAVAVVGTFLVLKGPVPGLLHVRQTNVSYTLVAHHVAGHLASGESPEDAASRALLQRIGKGSERWPYSCATVDRTIFTEGFDNSVAKENREQLLHVWLSLAKDNPLTELKHFGCVSSIVWMMTDEQEGPIYHMALPYYRKGERLRWFTDTALTDLDRGAGEAPIIPGLAERLAWAMPPPEWDLVWRPASYLFLFLFALSVGVRRRNDWTLGILAVPVLSHSGILAVSNVAQDVRYQLAVVAVALAASPLLLTARRPPAEVAS